MCGENGNRSLALFYTTLKRSVRGESVRSMQSVIFAAAAAAVMFAAPFCFPRTGTATAQETAHKRLRPVNSSPDGTAACLKSAESYLTRERDEARRQQHVNQTTINESRGLLARAQAAKDPAAEAAAQRAIDIATKALQKNKRREERAMKALGWLVRLKEGKGYPGKIGAFLPRADGDVRVRSPGGNEPPRRLTANSPPVVAPGDTVETGAGSHADLILPDGSLVSMDAKTSLTLASPSALDLLFGRLRAWVHHRFIKKFEVRTPSAAIAVRGTQFVVRQVKGKPASVVVIKGTVAFSNGRETKTVLVQAGQQSYILPDGSPAQPSKANIRDMRKWWE
jgi:hypothetical protein